MIITIGRECGSGGHQIGEQLAKYYQIPFYDRHILVAQAKRMGKYDELENFFSEKPMNSLLYSIALSDSNRMAGKTTLDRFMTCLTDESFVLIGRCGNYLFKDHPDATSVFIHADLDPRIENTMKKQQTDRIHAARLVKQVDAKRQEFHSHYTGENWGDARHYDLAVNSTAIGIDKTVKMIVDFIDAKKG